MTNLSRYKRDGLKILDRLDFDVEAPGSEGLDMTRLLREGKAFSGGQVDR